MILRYDAVLNGRSLGHIAPSIIVRDIDEKPAKMDTKTVQRAIRPGMRVTQQRRQSLEIVLHCNVRAYGGADRAQILDEIAYWVQDGGWLEISTRPGKRLRVTPTGLPSVGSSLNWTGNIDIAFTAYERPYWESKYPVAATIEDEGELIPLGTLPEAYVSCSITNEGAENLTTLTVRSGDTFITLRDLDVAPGEVVEIGYTDDDVMRITAAGVSALGNRTAESSDDLVAICRKANAIKVEANQSVRATFRAWGRYR